MTKISQSIGVMPTSISPRGQARLYFSWARKRSATFAGRILTASEPHPIKTKKTATRHTIAAVFVCSIVFSSTRRTGWQLLASGALDLGIQARLGASSFVRMNNTLSSSLVQSLENGWKQIFSSGSTCGCGFMQLANSGLQRALYSSVLGTVFQTLTMTLLGTCGGWHSILRPQTISDRTLCLLGNAI